MTREATLFSMLSIHINASQHGAILEPCTISPCPSRNIQMNVPTKVINTGIKGVELEDNYRSTFVSEKWNT